MKTVLLTTLPNRVATDLQNISDVELHILEITKEDNKKESLLKTFRGCSPEILLTYRCPYIVPEEILSMPSLGAYNIHPSLLPKYKGLNPWEEMYATHETKGGVTLHRLSTDVDAGEILIQRAFILCRNLQSDREQSDKIAAEIIRTYILGLRLPKTQ